MRAQCHASTLESYYSLQNDWDGEGGIAPNKVDINNALQFLNMIIESYIEEPVIGISSDGEINFVWDDREEGVYIDVGFIEGGYSYYSIDSNKNEKLKNEDNFNKDDLKCLIEILGPKLEVHL